MNNPWKFAEPHLPRSVLNHLRWAVPLFCALVVLGIVLLNQESGSKLMPFVYSLF